MCWQKISNISSLASIGGGIWSFFSSMKTKKYYKKIVDNSNFEKLTSVNSNLIEARKLYENIRKSYIIKNKNGINLNKIINYHLKIEACLDKTRMLIPSKYEDLLKSISSAKKQIELINDKKLHNDSNDYFKELGVYLTNIEDGIKLEKENIRGF